jgi:hypothetical protein
VAQASSRASAQKSAHGLVDRLMRATVGGGIKTLFKVSRELGVSIKDIVPRAET